MIIIYKKKRRKESVRLFILETADFSSFSQKDTYKTKSETLLL